jgi:hypothetical protein
VRDPTNKKEGSGSSAILLGSFFFWMGFYPDDIDIELFLAIY